MMLCPHCGDEITGHELALMMRAVNSEKQQEASRLNGSRPVKKGSKPRGWPKGKLRKPIEREED